MNEHVRSAFPLLQRTLDGKPLVYLDSAATALKPRVVLDAERAYSTDFTANIHRGKHALSQEASEAYEQARRRVARFLNAEPGEVVFVRNTTEALNLVAQGLPRASAGEDTVLVAATDHHSNLVPWMRRGKVALLTEDPCRPLTPAALERAIAAHRPRLVALSHASNVTGAVHPLRALCQVARAAGVLTVVDAAQSAPHLPLDVQALGCDFLAFSGHKLMGPTGIGVLYGAAEQLGRLSPLLVGGGTVERVTATGYTLKAPPHCFEAGTPSISGALGLAAALDFLEELSPAAVAAHERALAAALESGLRELPGTRLLMAEGPERLAIASVAPLTAQVSADHLAVVLSDSHQIMVRSGYHCAHPLFDQLGLPHGALRASAYLYNTVAEVERYTAALRKLLERLVGG